MWVLRLVFNGLYLAWLLGCCRCQFFFVSWMLSLHLSLGLPGSRLPVGISPYAVLINRLTFLFTRNRSASRLLCLFSNVDFFLQDGVVGPMPNPSFFRNWERFTYLSRGQSSLNMLYWQKKLMQKQSMIKHLVKLKILS